MAVVSGVALAGAAHAQPAQPAAPLPTSDDGSIDHAANAYRNSFPGLSAARAREAAVGEKARHALYTALHARADTYGGAWFDPPSGVVHVAVTTDRAGRDAVALGAQSRLRVTTHRVARTFAALERQAEAIRTGTDALARAVQGSVAVDVQHNQVAVALPDSVRLAGAAAPGLSLPPGVAVASGEPARAVEDACTTRADCTDSIRAGLYLNGGYCSVGFTARGDDRRFVVTAGHCSTGNGKSWSVGGVTFGTMSASYNSGDTDVSLIEVTKRPYTRQSAGQIYINWAADFQVPVYREVPSLDAITYGERVCLAANISDAAGSNDCGTIGLPTASNGGKIEVDGLDGCHGESGGGWYWPSDQGRYAYGIHSSSSYDGCRVAGGKSYFTALPAIGRKFGFDLEFETS